MSRKQSKKLAIVQAFTVRVGNARWLIVYSPLAGEWFVAGVQL